MPPQLRQTRVRQGIRALALGWVLLWTPLAPGTGKAPVLPDRFNATFDVEVLGQTVGQTVWTLEPQPGTGYRLEALTRAKGPFGALLPGERRERSLWDYDGQGRPRPLHYLFERTGSKPRTSRLDFDWGRGIATSVYRDRTRTLGIAPGTLDPLTYVLALMQDLTSGRADLAFTFAERGKVKTYHLTREGTETVETGEGPLRTERLVRTDEEGRRTTLWCAPSRGYLPARIEHEEPGSPTLVLRLVASKGLDPRP